MHYEEEAPRAHKLAVIFPGIGYRTDKPLLYYSGKLLKGMGWDVVPVPYAGFPEKVKGNPEKMKLSAEMALELIRLGWYVSFTGAVTFKNARRALEAIAAVPMDRIMIETDAPYLAPVPYRGRRNHSGYVPEVAKKIGEIKGMTQEAVAEATMENGLKFFHTAKEV